MELLNKYYTKTIAFETEFKRRSCCPKYYDEERKQVYRAFQLKNQEYYNLSIEMLNICYKYEHEFNYKISKNLTKLSNKELFGKMIKFYQKVIRLILFFGITNYLTENYNDKINEILTVFMMIIYDFCRFLIKKGELKIN